MVFVVVQSCPTLCDPMDCSTSGFLVLHCLLEFAQTHVHRVGDALQPSHPLSSSSPALNLPQHQGLLLFTSCGQSIGASSLASVLPMNIQYWFPLGLTGLISLLSKELSRVLQHHSSKASILWCAAFFMAQLSHPYVTTGKTTALTRWNFVGKVMSLFFNMLSRLAIAFLPRSSSVQFSRSVVSDSLLPHESQHTRPPCPSPSPRSKHLLIS